MELRDDGSCGDPRAIRPQHARVRSRSLQRPAPAARRDAEHAGFFAVNESDRANE
jgi:hypothetical protein